MESSEVESVLKVNNGETGRPEVAVFAALRREIEALARTVSVQSQLTRGECRILGSRYGGLKLVLVQTGPGGDRAVKAATMIFDEFQPRIGISLGFGGALREGLSAGDLIACQSVAHLADDGSLSERLGCDYQLLRVATEACKASRLDIRVGRSLTVDTVYGEPGVKQRLGDSFSAEILEMENYWLAREASARGVPLLAVRAVSDTLRQDLPPLQGAVNGRGETDKKRVIMALVLEPACVVSMVRLAKSAHLASSNLSSFLAALLSFWEGTSSRLQEGAESPPGDRAAPASR